MLYVRTLMNNTGTITNNFQAITKVFGSSYEIALLIVSPNQVLYEGTLKPDPENADEDKREGNLKVDAVQFTYPTKKDVTVLKGVSIDVKKNQIVALVGQSGCGKSSIIQLVERFYDPFAGRICYQGEDIKALDNKWYHQKQIALVQQEPILFSGTIRENIMYGVDKTGLTEQDLEAILDEACRQANALTFIKDEKLFPQGYDTVVGERGLRLSGG